MKAFFLYQGWLQDTASEMNKPIPQSVCTHSFNKARHNLYNYPQQTFRKKEFVHCAPCH